MNTVVSNDDIGFLEFNEHQTERKLFLVAGILLYFVLGAGYYSFPMWLNQIIAKHVSLSRSDLSILGGTGYITLGVSGALILAYSRVKLSDKSRFLSISFVGLGCVTVSWSILTWLALTPEDSPHSIVLVFVPMMLIGLTSGVFYTVWLGKQLPLIKLKWHFLYFAAGSLSFSVGAVVSLSLKLVLGDSDWMIMLLSSQTAVTAGLVLWVFVAFDRLFIPVPEAAAVGVLQPLLAVAADTCEDGSTATTAAAPKPHSRRTFQLLRDLFLFRRMLTTIELQNDEDSDMSSVQWYLILGSFMAFLSVGTTFLSNLGVLASGEVSDDDGDEDNHAALLVLIWSAVGQTAGRTIVPVVSFLIRRQFDTHQSSIKQVAVREAKIQNRTTLLLTLSVGLIFVTCLVIVRVLPNASFLVASTFISVAYGMMWTVVSTYPGFFPKQDFTIVFSAMQLVGAVATMTFVLVVSLCGLDNSQTFNALLIGSVVSVGMTLIALYSRVSAEPSSDSLLLLEDEDERESTVSVHVTLE